MNKLILVLGIVLGLLSCQDKKSESNVNPENVIKPETSTIADKLNDEDAAMLVMFEGKTYTIKKVNWNESKVTFEEGKIQYLLWEDGMPVKLNFNLHGTDILEKGSAEYSIPEATHGGIMIDLNFFDQKRDVSSSANKRIVFRKGKIMVKELTEHSLEMSFEGEGGEMLQINKNFPISGKVNINY